MKEIVGIIGFVIILLSITSLHLGNNLDVGDNFKLLQSKQQSIEVFILSRGFTPGNPHYEPQNVTAKIGTSVVWVNGDLVHHTVTNDQGIQGKLEGRIFDSGPIPPRSEFRLDTSRFLDDVYPYHCTIHPWVKGSLTLITEPINVATDKSVYNSGQKVTISGMVSIPTTSKYVSPTLPKKFVNATVTKSVSLKVLSPMNELLLSKDVPTLSGGKYSYTFTAGEPGVYTIKATINSFTASTTFLVTEVPREKLTTSAIRLEDAKGMPTSTPKVGQQILIRTPIKNTLQISQDYAYIVLIKNADQVTILLTWKKDSIAPLGLSTPAISWTPKSEGTYGIEVFIWKSIEEPEPLSSQVEKVSLNVKK